jgi:hypothetical protein
MLTEEEIEKKKPLWLVLAGLWRDDNEFELYKTKTNDGTLKNLKNFYPVSKHDKIKKVFENSNNRVIEKISYDYVARMMLSSKLALDEIKLIFEHEISPIFCNSDFKKRVFVEGEISKDILFATISENIEIQESDMALGKSIRNRSKQFIKNNKQIESDWKIIVNLFIKKKNEQEKLDVWISSKLLGEKENVDTRKQLWEAFSDFWLDNELQDFHFKNTVDLMTSCGYTLEKIESIFFYEVAPAVYNNLYTLPGGVWSIFDEDYLFSEIVKNIEKQDRNTFYRCWVKSRLGKFVMTKMVQDDWKKIIELYKVKNLEK